MEIKFFSEIFDAIEKAIKSIKAIASLPKDARDELRQTLGDTFKLLDTTLSMIIIRLGDILLLEDDNEFIKQVFQLNYASTWIQAEREFRLCKSLRHTLSETNRLTTKILHTVSINDWNEMKSHLQKVLEGENELGDFISRNFDSFSFLATTQLHTIQQRRENLKQFLDTLNTERRRLLKMEIDLYDNF